MVSIRVVTFGISQGYF